MATLDRWRPFLRVPKSISFPRMELRGRDFEPSLVVGRGEVRMPTQNRFEYTLVGAPSDPERMVRAFNAQWANPYDRLARFRLVGADDDGTEWALGWTVPEIQPGGGDWSFTGVVDGLSPEDHGQSIETKSSTELMFLVPVGHPMSFALMRAMPPLSPSSHRERTIEALGSQIRFRYEPSAGVLAITADHSDELPPTFTENWLGEPLRVLFGQLVYPRLVARNLGGGRTILFVARSPDLIQGAGWAAMWPAEEAAQTTEIFWQRYIELLTLFARSRNPDGNPNWETHKLTKLYEEIIQAARGTRWVWALTFASAIEGLINLLEPKGAPAPGAVQKAADSLIDHIQRWDGEERLRVAAANAVRRTLKSTTASGLRALVSAGVVTKDQRAAWEDVRNHVMHGELISPYSVKEEDDKLKALSRMVHSLTLELLQRLAPDGVTKEGESG